MPTGICITPKAKKYAEENHPRALFDRLRSSAKKGAIAALTARSAYDRKYPEAKAKKILTPKNPVK
jgi:hypothetical protein